MKLSVARVNTTRLMMDEASFQADAWSSFVRKAVNVGTKAEARAPPANRLKSRLGNMFAVLNASMAFVVPKARVARICRTNPASWLRAKANITVPAARAICLLAFVGASLMSEDYTLTMSAFSNRKKQNDCAIIYP